MAFIGNDSIYIGDDWYIGSWYNPVRTTTSNYIGQRDEDLWIFYNDLDRVITSLNFDSILPGNSVGLNIKARYRGFKPIKVIGFYLTDVPESFYNGNHNPDVDNSTLIEWADLHTGDEVPPGTPGLEIQFTDYESGNLLVKQFKTGQGDTSYSSVLYSGHENGILNRDDVINLGLRLTIPNVEGIRADRFHIGLGINFTEINTVLIDQLVSEGC